MDRIDAPPSTPPHLQPAGPASTGATTSGLAICSLVAGILGWTLLPWIGSIAAIVMGVMARGEIRRSGGAVAGDGLAIAGIVLGTLMLAVSVLTVIAIVLFFGGFALFLGWLGFSGYL